MCSDACSVASSKLRLWAPHRSYVHKRCILRTQAGDSVKAIYEGISQRQALPSFMGFYASRQTRGYKGKG